MELLKPSKFSSSPLIIFNHLLSSSHRQFNELWNVLAYAQHSWGARKIFYFLFFCLHTIISGFLMIDIWKSACVYTYDRYEFYFGRELFLISLAPPGWIALTSSVRHSMSKTATLSRARLIRLWFCDLSPHTTTAPVSQQWAWLI